MRVRISDKQRSIAGILFMLAIFLSGCASRPERVEQSDIIAAREELPVLMTDSVKTLISDSGVTRYRIETPEWLVFDKTEKPYQEFPHGIYLEQFDQQLKVQASMKADYAFYDEQAQVWTLRGHVHALNREGEQFDTPELNWSQQGKRIYSDSSILITREKSIIKGVGFDSNEEMTKYTILRPTGVFPIDEEE